MTKGPADDAQRVENTPYDSAQKTMMAKASSLLIPVINKLFHKSYTKNATIEQELTTLTTSGPDRTIIRRITDAILTISEQNQADRFHIEFEARPEKAIQKRFLEYGGMDAVLRAHKRGDGNYLAKFPYSGLVCLRPLAGEPKELVTYVGTSDGIIPHSIPTIYVHKLTIPAIRTDDLAFLAPFYLFRYAAELDTIEGDPVRLAELRNEFIELGLYFQELRDSGAITSDEFAVLVEMTNRVSQHLAANQDKIKKEVNHIMGGEVWKLAVDDFQREREDYKNRLKAQTAALEASNARVAQEAERATKEAERATKEAERATKYAENFISSARRRGADDATIVTDLQNVLGMSEAEAGTALASYDERQGRP